MSLWETANGWFAIIFRVRLNLISFTLIIHIEFKVGLLLLLTKNKSPINNKYHGYFQIIQLIKRGRI